MIRVRWIFAGIVAALTLTTVSVSGVVPEQRIQPIDRPDSLFALGLDHFDNNRPVDARWVFEQLVRSLPQTSEWHAPSQLMFARSLYRIGDLQGAGDAIAALLERTPAGVLPTNVVRLRTYYTPYAQYLLAMIAWQNNDRRAVVAHSWEVVRDPNAPPTLTKDARTLAQATVARADSLEFRGMDPVVQGFVRDAAALNRAIGLYHGGQWLAARSTAQALERSSTTNVFSHELATLISDIRSAERSELRIAVIAPLSGPDSLAGVELIRGVEFALEQQRSPMIGRPIVRNATTQLEAIRAAQELAADPSVRAIIGPLTTENTIAAAAVLNCSEVPIIAPTATGVGIASIGENVFQINTTPDAQGRLLAHVAVDSLRARTVATLSSVEPQDRAMANAFAEAVRELGGEVFIQEWFFPNTADLRPQLSEIRLASLLGDTLISEETRRRLALNMPTELDTMKIMREARTIDVLLVASNNPRDIVNIAAQIPTQKIWARVLGGSIWGEQRVRQEAGEDAEGVIYATSFDPNGPESRRFVDAYRLARRENPSNIAALAYDASSLVSEAISKGARTRGQIRDYLAAVAGKQGATSGITFDESGANVEANLRLIRGGVVNIITDWTTLERPSTWGVSVPVEGAGTSPDIR